MSAAAQRESGPVVVRLLQKMQTIEHALQCCELGQCKPADVAVVAYLASHMDNETGECVRKYQTIAKGCGMGRSALIHSLKRLEDAKVIRRQERYGGRIGRRAYGYHLGELPDQAPQTGTHASEIRTSEVRNPNLQVVSSQHSLDSPGDQSSSQNVDWDKHADWLAEVGQYGKRYGFGGEAGAAEDLATWCEDVGEQRLLAAIARAREKGLYGATLEDFLANTWGKGQRRRARGSRRQGGPPSLAAAPRHVLNGTVPEIRDTRGVIAAARKYLERGT